MTAPCKRRPFVLYDKAKLSEFYLQEENLEKIIAEMAVTGVQFYSQFFLRHAVGLAQVLGLYSIHLGFFVLSLAMMARWAQHRPPINDLHLLGCKYYRDRLTSLCLCKKLGKRDLKSISDLHKRRNGRERRGLKSPSVQLTTKMRQATHLSGSLSHFSVGGYLHC